MVAGINEPPKFSNMESAGAEDYESEVTSAKHVMSSEHHQLGAGLEVTQDPSDGPPLGRHDRQRDHSRTNWG